MTQRKLKFNLYIAAISSLLNTFLNVVFILRWQSIGAAYATLFTVIVTGIINTTYLLHILKDNNAEIES